MTPDHPPLSYVQFRQAFELACDVYAVKLMTAAGYDPRALARWLQSLPVLPSLQKAFSDRADPAIRIAAVEKAIAAAQ
jgi:predicted Zn-dependent protease